MIFNWKKTHTNEKTEHISKGQNVYVLEFTQTNATSLSGYASRPLVYFKNV